MLPVKKIYIDSKYKTSDSKSDSNFKFQLPGHPGAARPDPRLRGRSLEL